MAFVPVPKDLAKVKTKVALNLTKRQIISFSIGGIIGFTVYMNLKKILPNDISVLIMMACVLPFFFLGVYERDGLNFEKIIKYYYESKIKNPHVRTYRNKNFYEFLLKQPAKGEVKLAKSKSATKKAAKKITKQ